jgi:XTP/dITP diphosphohydrolase
MMTTMVRRGAEGAGERKEIFFATRNIHKFREAESILSPYGITLKHLNFKAVEVQSDDLVEIAEVCLTQVLSPYALPVIVEDAGLFIEALEGFPGAYSSYVYRTIGVSGILKLMEEVENRKAYFLSAVAYGKPGMKALTFTGKVEGLLTAESRGQEGFGFDPIFQPLDASKTFAEMSLSEKNAYSHRAAALRKLGEWFIENELSSS